MTNSNEDILSHNKHIIFDQPSSAKRAKAPSAPRNKWGHSHSQLFLASHTFTVIERPELLAADQLSFLVVVFCWLLLLLPCSFICYRKTVCIFFLTGATGRKDRFPPHIKCDQSSVPSSSTTQFSWGRKRGKWKQRYTPKTDLLSVTEMFTLIQRST